MADVYSIFGTLLALGIAFPGFLATWWLIAPSKVKLAQHRLADTPKRSVAMGIASIILIAIPISILIALPLAFSSFLGSLLIVLLLTFAGLGTAAIAANMAEQLQSDKDSEIELADFVRAAVAMELAAAFPVVGWFIVIPLTLLAGLGAASFALLGWEAKQRNEATSSIKASPTKA